MKRFFGFAAIFVVLMCASCAKNEPGTSPGSASQRATVTMKDGTVNEGSVVASSEKEITLAGEDKITRTIPLDQVKSIEYRDSAAAKEIEPVNTANEGGTGKAKALTPAPVTKGSPLVEKAASTASAEKPRPALELPAGTQISIRSDVAIDSATASEGETFPGEVTVDVKDPAGNVVVPARSSAKIIIRSASGGSIRGASDLVLALTSVKIGGREHSLNTTDVSKIGKSGIGANKRTATYTGGGAAVGAIIGAIAGGGKGAAIGAASGAGAGALTQILTKGKSIRLPAETILTFKLERSLSL